MKMFLSIKKHRGFWNKILTILIITLLLPLGNFTNAVSGITFGDVNGNGILDIDDAQLIAKYLAMEIYTLPHPENADATQDGKITIEDSLAIEQKINGTSLIVVVRAEYGLPGKIYVGSIVRVEVFEKFFPFNVTSGKVRIISLSTGYDSGEQKLTFERSGRSLYYHWDTWGLPTVSDYEIYVMLSGSPMPQKPNSVVSLSPRIFEIPIIEEVQDAYISTPGIALEFNRVFSQASTYTTYLGPLGYGWVHNFDIHLEEFTDGRIVFFGSDGFNQWFIKNSDGTYTALGNFDKLTRDPNGTFQLKEKTGIIYHFRSDLLLDYIQDPTGKRITNSYNANKHLIKISHSNGLSLILEYNTYGRISKLIDHANRETTYEYSQDGKYLLKVTVPGNSITQYTYSIGQGESSDHHLTSIIYPDKTHVYYTYDSEGRLTSQEGDLGNGRIVYSYNPNGTTNIKDAAGGVTTIKVNEYGQPIEVIDPNGTLNQFKYDSNLNLVKITDSLGYNYNLLYDERGNIVQITDPLGNQIKLGWDPNFNKITWIKDSLERTTTYSYNIQGNLIEITYPDGSKEKYTYNKNNILLSKKNGNGQIINYAFDNRGLLISKTYPDTTSITYTYDNVGRMTKASDPTGIIIFEYNNLDQPVRVTYPGNRCFQYQYDDMGKCIQMIDPDGKIQIYEYDKAGRIVKISDETGQTIVNYEYDNANRRTRKNLGNGAYITYEYDSIGQILKIVNYNPTGEIISYFKYTYDAVGNCLSKESIEGIEYYNYDALNQLIKVRYPDGNITEYVYDPMGNRLAVNENNITTNYKVNVLNQYLTVGSTSYKYDSNGNMISKIDSTQTTYYDYNYEDQLIRVKTPTETITYTYNALGLRNSRTDSYGSIKYLWDGYSVSLEENELHQTLVSYIWGDILDEVICMERGSSIYYYTQDALLSISDILNESGKVVEHYNYNVFGKPHIKSSIDNTLFFTGSKYDFKINLQYNRYRYYSPDLGRFITRDPIGYSSGLNLYEYVWSNPVIYLDPYGLVVQQIIFNAIMGVIAGDMPGGSVIGSAIGGILGTPLGIPGIILIGIVGSFLGGLIGFDEAVMNSISFAMNYMRARATLGKKVIPNIKKGLGGQCPTFIQLSNNTETTFFYQTDLDISHTQIAGKITIPAKNSLLRSDIPIFGVAGGTSFKEYRVEYGQGKNPSEWCLIESSTTPQQTIEVGLTEIPLMQGDVDLRGNLATWNTGLKNWVHLPWHPPEDPTDLNGVYTLRLTVIGLDGEVVEDRMVVEVGRVIAECLPGIAISPDQRVVMRFSEHSLTEPYRVYTILPFSDLDEDEPSLPAWIHVVGSIYRIREPGDKFTKDVSLEFSLGVDELDEYAAEHVGIMRFDVPSNTWVWLDTYYSTNKTIFSTALVELPTPEAIYALGYDPLNFKSQQINDVREIDPLVPISSEILIHDSFEEDVGYWVSRDRFIGTDLDRVKFSPDGSYALKVTSQLYGGSFAVTVLDRSFDVLEYPIMSFDYCIGPSVKTDFYLLVNERWYNVGFTDDPTDFRNRDVNIANIGQIDGIIADGEWHSASVNLYELLREKTRNTQVDAIMMADWDVTGYMKLEFGDNGQGVAYYIDNFKIFTDSEKDRTDVLVVDAFNVSKSTNLLNGLTGTFSSPGTEYCQAIDIDDYTAESDNHVLKIIYDTSQPNSYCGYWTSLQNADIKDFTEVSLRIYSTKSIPSMYLGLRSGPWVETKVLLESYLSSPDVDSWRTVTIPLSAFHDLSNLSSLDALFLTFENQISSGKGVIFIDEVEFHKQPSYGKIVDFTLNSMDHNLVGGEFRTIQKEAANISCIYNFDETNSSYISNAEISFGGNISLGLGQGRFSYAIWETDLLGFDTRTFQDLVLRIRGEKGGEKPNIWLDDGTTRRTVRAKEFSPLTTSWQEIRIPLEKYASQGVDLSHLEAIQIVFEWEKMEGTIYVSEIYFEENNQGEMVSIPTQTSEFGVKETSELKNVNSTTINPYLFLLVLILSSLGLGVRYTYKLLRVGGNLDQKRYG
jgi:RHS repeat-associated protein